MDLEPENPRRLGAQREHENGGNTGVVPVLKLGVQDSIIRYDRYMDE